MNLTQMTIISTSVGKNHFKKKKRRRHCSKKKKKVRNAVFGCNLQNDRMISVHFQDKPFNITVIQVYGLTNDAEEAEVE